MPLSRPVVGLNEAVTASDAIPAQHDQIALYVVSGVFEDVVQGETVGLTTEATFTPA